MAVKERKKERRRSMSKPKETRFSLKHSLTFPLGSIRLNLPPDLYRLTDEERTFSAQ